MGRSRSRCQKQTPHDDFPRESHDNLSIKAGTTHDFSGEGLLKQECHPVLDKDEDREEKACERLFPESGERVVGPGTSEG